MKNIIQETYSNESPETKREIEKERRALYEDSGSEEDGDVADGSEADCNSESDVEMDDD